MQQNNLRNTLIVILATFLAGGLIIFFQRNVDHSNQNQLRQQIDDYQKTQDDLSELAQEETIDDATTSDAVIDAVMTSCFTQELITLPPATTTWPQQRNYLVGVQIFRAPNMQVIREPAMESTGLESFQVISDIYEGGFMRIYDLRVRQYSTQDARGISMSYVPANNAWFVGTKECTPVSSAVSIGDWPVFALDLSQDMIIHKKFIIAHPTVDDNPDRSPVLVEFEIYQDTATMGEEERQNFDTYMTLFEQVTQSVRFFNPE